jgi:hypothetical protein
MELTWIPNDREHDFLSIELCVVPFRELFVSQIWYFSKNYPMFAQVRTVVEVFHISNTTYDDMFPSRIPPGEIPAIPIPIANRGRLLLVLPEIEQRLIEEIRSQQQKSDYLTPKECRAFVSVLMSTDENWVFIDHYWWRPFLKRTDIIGASDATSAKWRGW